MLQQPYQGLPKCSITHTHTHIYIFSPPTRETVEKQLHPKELRSAKAPSSFLSVAPGVFLKPQNPSQPWESDEEETLLAACPGALAHPAAAVPSRARSAGLPTALQTRRDRGAPVAQPQPPPHHRCSHGHFLRGINALEPYRQFLNWGWPLALLRCSR